MHTHSQGHPVPNRRSSPPWWGGPVLRSLALGAALGLALALPLSVQAETFRCRAGDVPCLIDAINAANANGEANTIHLAQGSYSLTRPDNDMIITNGPNGLPSVTSTLTIRGAEDGATTIERVVSDPPFRLLHVAEGGVLTIEKLILRGGEVLINGGGLFNRGTVLLINVTVTANAVFMGSPGDGNGGGIWNEGTLILTNTTIARNRAMSNRGGGIANSGGTVLITNSTLAQNLAEQAGGGLFNRGGTVILINTTVARNSGIAGEGREGVGLANASDASGTIALQNTIVALNTIQGEARDCTGPVTSLGNNLIGELMGCDITPQPSDPPGDPGLGPFTDNGRPGQGHVPLLEGSPAIDAGNDALCSRTDQLGQPREGVCDIGAFEFQAGVAPAVIVYVGYLDNESGPPDPAETPTPFDADANTILISTGGVDTRHDTGVIRFENRTGVPVIIDPGLQVTTEQAVFQLWDSFLPLTLEPGQNLVLAQTALFDFDTSDFGLGMDPVVSGSVNGRAFSFTDTARVLLGRDDAGAIGLNETTSYQILGRIE